MAKSFHLILLFLNLFFIITSSIIQQDYLMSTSNKPRNKPHKTKTRGYLAQKGCEINPKTYKIVEKVDVAEDNIQKDENDSLLLELSDNEYASLNSNSTKKKEKKVKKTKTKTIDTQSIEATGENVVEHNATKEKEGKSYSEKQSSTKSKKKKTRKQKVQEEIMEEVEESWFDDDYEEHKIIQGKKANNKKTSSISYAKKLIRKSREIDPFKINRIHMSLEAEIGLMQYQDYLKENKVIMAKAEEKPGKDDNELGIKKGIEQVTTLFEGYRDCVYYTGFEMDEFMMILTYCTHICEFDESNGWIIPTETNDVEFNHSKISIEYALFIYMVHIKRFPTDIDLFFMVGLDRIYKKCKNPSQTMSDILALIMKSNFVNRGIESMIHTLRNANLDDVPTLDEGYHPIFNFVIENLNKCHYIVDGRHQPVTKKLDKNKKYKKKYFSFKHKGFGFKYNIYVDSKVKCVEISPILPAVIHDTHLHNMTLSDKLVPNGNFVVGDSGYTGAKKCIHIFRQPKKTPATKQFTYVASSKNIIMEIKLYNEEENRYTTKKVEGTCFIRGTFIEEIKDKTLLKGYKQESNGNYSKFEGKVDGYTTTACDDLPKESTFEIDGNGIVLWFDGKSSVCLLSFEGNGKLWKNHDEEYQIETKLMIDENGILGRNSNEKAVELYNALLSKIRVKVEQHFGRMIVLFKVSSRIYNRSEDQYRITIQFTHALTNFHIHLHPIIKFPFYLFHRKYKEIMNLKINDNMIQRIPIPMKAQKLLQEIVGTKRKHDFLEDYISEVNGIPINGKGSTRIDDEWNFNVENLNDEKVKFEINNAINNWIQSKNMMEFDDVEKEFESICFMENFADVVDYLKKSVKAADAFTKVFQNDREIEEYAKNVIKDLKLRIEKPDEITIIEMNDVNLSLDPKIYSESTLKEKKEFCNSLLAEGKLQQPIKRKGSIRKRTNKHLEENEHFEESLNILDNMNIKKNSLNENKEEILNESLDISNISEIKPNQTEKEMNESEKSLIIVNNPFQFKNAQIRNNSSGLNIPKNLYDIGEKVENEWVHSFVFDLFLETTESLFQDNHYIIPMNISNNMIEGKKISINVETKISMCFQSKKWIHFIINKNRNHWICLTVDTTNFHLYIIDSLKEAKETMRKYLINVIQYFKNLFNRGELELCFVNIPMQKTGWECGYQVMFYLFIICTKCLLNYETIESYFDEKRYDSFLHVFSRIKENIYKSIQKEKETNESAYLVYANCFYLDSLNALKSIL